MLSIGEVGSDSALDLGVVSGSAEIYALPCAATRLSGLDLLLADATCLLLPPFSPWLSYREFTSSSTFPGKHLRTAPAAVHLYHSVS